MKKKKNIFSGEVMKIEFYKHSISEQDITRAVKTLRSRFITTGPETKKFEEVHGRKPKIACLGLTYKPDIDDLRESPALYIVKKLKEESFEIFPVEPNIGESSEFEIANALYLYGEEKRSRIIATTIKKYQKSNEIKTTLDLANLISSVVRSGKNKHPATRSFQAIRIVINDELKQLSEALEQTIKVLAINGRLSVITFHSIEDRIVKQFIRKYSRPKEAPKGLPIRTSEGNQCALKDLGKIKPSKQEIMTNRRSRSATLRLAQKC